MQHGKAGQINGKGNRMIQNSSATRRRLAITTLVIGIVALALPTAARAQKAEPHYRPSLPTLCAYLDSRRKDDHPGSPYTFYYERVVYEAAGFSDAEFEAASDEEISRRVRAVWDDKIRHLRCGPNGIPSTTDPFRFAVTLNFDDFIRDTLSWWKIDLNRLHHDIGTERFTGTYLDEVDHKISISSGVAKSTLEAYRKSMIAMGAKRATELPQN